MGAVRGAETEDILRALRSGLHVFVTGPRGIGRSHVVAQVSTLLAAEGTAVLSLDDAEGDPAALTSALTAAADGSCTVLLSARSAAQLGPPAQALLRAGRAVTVELAPLLLPDAARLLAEAGGTRPDERRVLVLHERSGGNPRLLLRLAHTPSGTVTPDAVGTVAELLSGLDEGLRRALVFVAVGEPLPADVAIAGLGAQILESAERAELIVLRPETDLIQLGPPLAREDVLAVIDAAERRSAGSAVACAWSSTRDDAHARLRIALLGIEGGDPVPVPLLLEHAELVYVSDPALSVRIMEAARPRVSTSADRLRLASLLSHHHRSPEAQELLDGLDASVLPAQERMGVILTRAFLNVMPEHRPAHALADLEAAIDELGADPMALALRSTALWRLRRVAEAIDQARVIRETAHAPPGARAHAGLTLGAASFLAGDRRTASDVFAQVEREAAAAGAGLPEALESARLTDLSARLECGAPPRLSIRSAREGYIRALETGDDGVRAHFAYSEAFARLQNGDVVAAVERIAQVEDIHAMWRQTMVPWRASLTCQILASAGHSAKAEEVLMSLVGTRYAPSFDHQVEQAVAAVSASRGELATARTTLADGARRAAVQGAHGAVSILRYQAVTYGDADAARAILATRDGFLSEAQRIHARAVLAGDTGALLDAADALNDVGHAWFAAAAAGSSVVSAAAAGDRGGLADAWRVVADLAHPRAPRIPVLIAAGDRLISPRRREVAERAARGDSDAVIGQSLGISARTVQVHLTAAFAVLGVTSRRALGARLAVLDGRATSSSTS